MRELNHISVLRAALESAREITLSLYAHLSDGQLQVPCLPTVNPPLWEMAHVGWFQEFWCLRHRAGAEPLPSRLADADPMLNSAIIPHSQRWQLPRLTSKVVRRYLDQGFADTLEALETSNENQRYFFELALFHEDMHGEAMLMTLQTLGLPAPGFDHSTLQRLAPFRTSGDVAFEGGEFEMGSRPEGAFAFDNELPAHRVHVAPFALSSTAVSNNEFLAFVAAGGYTRREFWSDEGWCWREEAAAKTPRYWQKDHGQWLVRRYDSWEPLVGDEAVVHVNAFEAEAYCRFAGRRLPTEAEWEFAARAALAPGRDRYPWGDSPVRPENVNLDGRYGRPVSPAALPATDSRHGLRQMIGNVWEWTASPFAPYPGFTAGPYAEYSQPWFHTHRALRGGCFATRARLVHNRWRNFYTPERNDIFAGFRTATRLDPAEKPARKD